MAIRTIYLLLPCLILLGCHNAVSPKQADDRPPESAETEEAVVEEDREPLSQRIRRISPRRYFKKSK